MLETAIKRKLNLTPPPSSEHNPVSTVQVSVLIQCLLKSLLARYVVLCCLSTSEDDFAELA